MKMKFLPVLSLTLFFIHSITIAKTTEIDTTWALSFYPLQTGNYWEYSEKVAEGDYVYHEGKFSVEIVGDTLMNNGKSYKILQKQYVDSLSCEYIFERVDSLSGNVYRFNTIDYDNIHTEYLIDSLYAQVGDTVLSQRYYRGKTESFSAVAFTNEFWYNYFGEMQFWKMFGDVTQIPGYNYALGENIGLRILLIGHETRPLFIELLYAKIDGKEYRLQTNVDKRNVTKIQTYELLHNYPNPFNNSTIICYTTLAETGLIDLSIYNLRGQKVVTLYNGINEKGEHSVLFTDIKLASGIYIMRLESSGQVLTKKINLVR